MAMHSLRPLVRWSIRSSIHYAPISIIDQSNINRRQFSLDSAFVYLPSYFTHWSMTELCQWTLENVHTNVGLPWWATVIGTTLAFKLLTSPLLYAGERAMATQHRLKVLVAQKLPDIKAQVEHLATINNIPQDKKQLWVKASAKKYERVLMRQMRSHPFTAVCWPLLQAPIWIGMSFGIRNLSGRNPFYLEYDDIFVDEMQTQGVLWFSNLTVPDPLLILPMATCLLYLLAPTVLFLGMPPGAEKTTMARINRALNVAITLGITIYAIRFPAIVTLYWMTSMLLTILLRLSLKLPRVRRSLSIDQSPYRSDKPFRELILRAIGLWRPKVNVSDDSIRRK